MTPIMLSHLYQEISPKTAHLAFQALYMLTRTGEDHIKTRQISIIQSMYMTRFDHSFIPLSSLSSTVLKEMWGEIPKKEEERTLSHLGLGLALLLQIGADQSPTHHEQQHKMAQYILNTLRPMRGPSLILEYQAQIKDVLYKHISPQLHNAEAKKSLSLFLFSSKKNREQKRNQQN